MVRQRERGLEGRERQLFGGAAGGGGGQEVEPQIRPVEEPEMPV